MNVILKSLVLLFLLHTTIDKVFGESTKKLSEAEDHSNIKIENDIDATTNSKPNKRALPSNIESKIINILRPVPIVDTIEEEDKYGNSGDKFNNIGRKVVNGVEKMATIVNSLISVPQEAAKKVSKSLTQALDNLGGKLVGLQ